VCMEVVDLGGEGGHEGWHGLGPIACCKWAWPLIKDKDLGHGNWNKQERERERRKN